jgi:hypothetical protein
MFKIGLALAATLVSHFIGVTYAAEKIALTCTGTALDIPTKRASPGDLSIVIDLTERTLSVGGRPLPIEKITDIKIDFNGFSDSHQKMHWFGWLDRLSGQANVTTAYNGKPWTQHGHL